MYLLLPKAWQELTTGSVSVEVSECEFQDHVGNCALIAAVLHGETKSNNAPNEAGKGVGDHSLLFIGQK